MIGYILGILVAYCLGLYTIHIILSDYKKSSLRFKNIQRDLIFHFIMSLFSWGSVVVYIILIIQLHIYKN
jgi:hypothetical protein